MFFKYFLVVLKHLTSTSVIPSATQEQNHKIINSGSLALKVMSLNFFSQFLQQNNRFGPKTYMEKVLSNEITTEILCYYANYCYWNSRSFPYMRTYLFMYLSVFLSLSINFFNNFAFY